MASDTNEVNPYQVPKARDEDKLAKRPKKKASGSSDGDTTARSRIVDAFVGTRKWLTFFGVLSYIGAAATVIFVVWALQPASALRGIGGVGFMSFVVGSVVGIGLYVLISLKLFRYRDAIDKVVAEGGKLGTVAHAVERQQEWWSFIGRLTIVGLVLYGLMLLGFAVLAPSN